MIVNNCKAWSVAVTFPIGSVDAEGKKRRWSLNETITAVAETAARAIQAVQAQWPDAVIWSANHVGSKTILIVDSANCSEGEYNGR